MKKVKTLSSDSRIIPLLVLLILVLTIPLAIYLIKNNQIFRTGAAADVSLSIQPNSAQLPPNTTFKLMADSGNKEVSSLRVKITFDPSVLQLTNEVSTSGELEEVITKTPMSEANSTGSITISVAQSESQPYGPSGNFEIASMNFSTTSSNETQTQISFDNSEIQIQDSLGSELTTESSPSSLTINQSTATADGEIFLQTSSNTYNIGETFPVEIYFNPHEKTISSVSMRISYPYLQTPEELKAIDVQPASSLTSTGKWSFPVNKVYLQDNNVVIDLSAINSTVSGYSGGNTHLATINFKANALSDNTLVFDPNETKMLTKSEPVTNILDSANGISLTITEDSVAPETISNLNVTSANNSSITLTWSAPADSGSTNNQAYSYDLRYSTSNLSESNWNNALQASSIPNPAPAGTIQSATISGLEASQTYYFGIKSTDENGNISALSNIVSANTSGVTLEYMFKLQGLTSSGIQKTILTDVLSNSEPIISDEQPLASGSNGVFKNTFSNLAATTYDVRIKAPGYLSRLFENINLSSSGNSFDWTAAELQAGDFDSNNILNVNDVGLILSVHTDLSVAVDSSNSIYDIDGNGIINIIDIAIVLSNYTDINVYGE